MAKKPTLVKPTTSDAAPDETLTTPQPESAPPVVKPQVVGKSQFGPVQTDNKQKP